MLAGARAAPTCRCRARYAFCDDVAVNDAPFYVMEKVDGVILRTPARRSRRSRPTTPRRCSEELVDVLVAIHAVDYDAVGLGEFGHPDGYLERQVRRWGEQWERSKTRELPAIDELARRLRAALPDVAAADDRARRLPPRQHDARARRPGPRSSRCSTGRWRRSATRSPTSGCSSLYWGRDDAQIGDVGATIDAERRLPDARRDRRALREAVGPRRRASSTSTRCSRRTSSRSSSKASTRAS